MNFTALINTLGDQSKDNKLNCKKLILEEPNHNITATMQQSLVLAISYSLQHKGIIEAAKEFAQDLDVQHKNAAKTCANLMAMNNIYYRGMHLIGDKELEQQPAGLRMQGIMQHGIDKGLFELMSLAISALNGCGLCLKSHYFQLKKDYTVEQIAYALKLASVLNALKQNII